MAKKEIRFSNDENKEFPEFKIKPEFVNKLMRHARNPTGVIGKFYGEYMGKDHAEVTEWGLKDIIIESTYVILDIGFGAGDNIYNLAEKVSKGKVYGIDLSEAMVEIASEKNKKFIKKKRVELSKGSLSDLPFHDNMFDLITAVVTIHFWPNILNDFKEVYRVLKPEGIFLIISNNYKHDLFKERNDDWNKNTGAKVYSVEELKEFIIKAGFSIIKFLTHEKKNWIKIMGMRQ